MNIPIRRSACSDPRCSVTVCEGFFNPDRQRRAGTGLQALPCRTAQSLTCSNRSMDDGNLVNDLPDWWPYPVQCGHGHPWSPGHVLVSYVRCLCRADEGIFGHTVVHCTTGGCRSAWYRPQHYPSSAAPPRHRHSRPRTYVGDRTRNGAQHRWEPSGEPPSADTVRFRAH